MPRTSKRVPLLYLAPWVDFGGTDKNTIDWFRAIDRERFAPYLLTTQASPNRRIDEVAGLAEEVWVLPDLMAGEDMPGFILDFIVARKIEVVHIMNARLGFDLLPDLHCLPQPPGIVVQLHVEEADRSGYVRYVTTRYGNLVDRFSVTSEHLAAAVEDYGVPDDKIAVVYIGVDGEGEFSPDRAEPEALDRDRLQVLFPVRVVQQKDPLLMVEVARRLRDRGVDFQLHVLGEGDLEDAVRAKVRDNGLGEQVLSHPPTPTPQRWYAAADAVLLTSEYEGVPAAVYEAMAMGVPIVAAALPGIVELLGAGYDGLVDPREDVDRYVEVLARLAQDPAYRDSHGRELRERALERFTLRQMAEGHEILYLDVATGRDPGGEGPAPEPLPEPLRFGDRPQGEQPLVSVVVPHYNQAQVLSQCIDSIRAQTYPAVELIVVDDCSTEAATKELLDRLEGETDTTVVRLDRNGGPSRARNHGVELCEGRYVLPVDADNLLMPEAIERLVAQLSEAGEEIGFVYPQIQYFGNRQELYVPPEYNVYTLLHGNYIDACSLIDREVFDAGLRYREEIVLGHEDWEFALRLAAHGVRGELARAPTLRYRKLGFNRSDTVDYGGERFAQKLAAMSLFSGHELEVKSAESPALTLACMAPLAAGPARAEIAARLAAQTSIDVELIAPLAGEWPATAPVPPLRRLDPAAAGEPAAALRLAREGMRGATMVLSADPRLELLAEPTFVEMVMRRFAATGAPDAIAFVDAGAAARFPFRALGAAEVDPLAVHTIAWRTDTEASLPHGLQSVADRVVHGVAELFSAVGARLEWRHAPAGEAPTATITDAPWAPVASPGPRAAGSSLVVPILPGAGTYRVPRWDHLHSWVPPQSTGLLIRYRRDHDEAYVAHTGEAPGGDYELDRHLGSLRGDGFEGTARLLFRDGRYFTMPREEWRPLEEGEREIGYVELAPLPQLVQLVVGVHRRTEQRVLVTPPDDPLLDDVLLETHLGFIEPFPAHPRIAPPVGPPDGMRGLVKTIDLEARRHRYALGRIPAGELVGELGAITTVEPGGMIPIWIVDDRLVTAEHAPPATEAGASETARWIAEPAKWGGLADPGSRLRSIGRRSTMAGVRLLRGGDPAATPPRPPDGYLYDGRRPGYLPIFAGYHPITGDQLLVLSPEDIVRLGYDGPHELGYVRPIAPVTGSTEQAIPQIPWARRFGIVPRNG